MSAKGGPLSPSLQLDSSYNMSELLVPDFLKMQQRRTRKGFGDEEEAEEEEGEEDTHN